MNFSNTSPLLVEEDDSSINLVPLIDVVFTLLVFLFLSTTFNHNRVLDLKLPEASEGKSTEQNKLPTLSISANRDVLLNGQKVDMNQLESALGNLTTSSPTPPNGLVIQADKEVPHGLVVSAMNAALKAHLTNVSISTIESYR